MDNNDKKLKFIEAMTRHGLQHFDSGGTTISQNNNPNQASNPVGSTTASGINPFNSISAAPASVGNTAQNIAGDFTVQNQYQAGLAPTDYTSYGSTIGQAGQNALAGYGQAQNIQGQQQALANTLQQQSMGQGPNVAQNQLNATTGQNIAAQGAMAAGQRGASSNVGLIARNVGQQGAATQQQAVGQGATLGAQQQIAAQQNLAAQQAAMGQQNIGEQGVNNQLFGGAASAQNAQNANEITNLGNAQGINASIAQNNANAVNKTTGGLLNSAGSIAAMFSQGGTAELSSMHPHLQHVAKLYHVKHFAEGGIYSGQQTAPLQKYALPEGQGVDMPQPPKMPGQGGSPSDQSSAISGVNGGAGTSQGMNDGGANQMAGADSTDSMAGASSIMSAKKGGKVPGKAMVKDDSSKNDTVPAMLSAGEIVLPRHITMHPNAPAMAAQFVANELKKRGKK
jgi:hypothetical protein